MNFRKQGRWFKVTRNISKEDDDLNKSVNYRVFPLFRDLFLSLKELQRGRDAPRDRKHASVFSFPPQMAQCPGLAQASTSSFIQVSDVWQGPRCLSLLPLPLFLGP